MTIRRIVFLAAGLTALCLAPARAADMPPAANPVAVLKAQPVVPAFTWTGFYVGLNAGYGAQNTTQSNSVSGSDAFGSLIAGLAPSNLSNEPRGPVLGGQLGYNYQWGSLLLLGVEEQLDWSKISNSSGTGSSILAAITGASSVSQNVDWLSFTNVRVGIVPSQHFVTYATGGLAVGGVKTSAASSVTAPGVTLSGSQALDQTRVGWDAGLGFEFAINSNWTLRADAKYYDLGTPTGSFSTNGATGIAPLGVNFSDPTKGYIGTVGVNFKFN